MENIDNEKSLVLTGEIIDEQETLEDVCREADEKNSQQLAKELKELGDQYIQAKRRQLEAKLSLKSIVDEASYAGISKQMLETYANLLVTSEFNKFAIFGAINEKKEEGYCEDEE